MLRGGRRWETPSNEQKEENEPRERNKGNRDGLVINTTAWNVSSQPLLPAGFWSQSFHFPLQWDRQLLSQTVQRGKAAFLRGWRHLVGFPPSIPFPNLALAPGALELAGIYLKSFLQRRVFICYERDFFQPLSLFGFSCRGIGSCSTVRFSLATDIY